MGRQGRYELGVVAAAACLVMLLTFVPVAASAGGWQTFSDSRYGIRVAIPAGWHTVPPTVSGIKAEITKLGKQNDAGLATVYATFIDTAAARKQTLSYYFQAFQFVPKAAVQPDFAISVARTTAQIAADKKALATSFAHSYSSGRPGTTISKQAVVKVPAGRAALVEGRQTVSGTAERFQVYVLSKGDLLFVLSLRAAANSQAAAATFAGIVKRFAFS